MSIMIFMFLCFSGLVVMFYFILRNQERLFEAMQEEHAQMRVMLRLLEARLQEEGGQPAAAPAQPEHVVDGPLSLQAEELRAERQDNGLELLFDPQQRVRR